MEENTKKPVRGIKIQSLNYGMIFVACVLYVLLLYMTFHASTKYNAMVSDTDAYIACQDDAALISNGSDQLTEQVRLYTVTMDKEHVEEYFTEAYVTRRREKALERMKGHMVSDEIYGILEKALADSNKLMEREIYAMKLVAVAQGQDMTEFPDVEAVSLTDEDQSLEPKEMTEKARELVFGREYQSAKAVIMGDISSFLDEVLEETKKRQEDSAWQLKRTMKNQNVLLSLLFVENIFTFFMIIRLIIKPLRIYIKNIREDKMLEITGSYEFQYLALTYNDIYELNAANEDMLRYRAEHDPLTGIINRGAFEQVKQAFKRKPVSIALLIIDVDKFKQINDGYGHETGDLVLKKVAKLLEDSFRTTDFPARIGGDEFAVLATDITPEMEAVIGGKIDAINETLMNPSDGLPKVSLSVGGAFSNSGFSDSLYKKADTALYQVKEHGRCGYRFYREGIRNDVEK